MDRNTIKTLLNDLKSSSASKVLETLIQIRTRVIKNDDGVRRLRECGGLENLVALLRKPNEKILDIVLSTLGNCCMEKESCLEVGKYKISSALVTIVKCISRDSIVGRACRLVGNLAQETANAEQLHSDGAVGVLLTIIGNSDKSTSHQTLSMAVRAIRLLWMVTDRREDMLASGAVRAVAILLTNECESADLIKVSAGEQKKTKKAICKKSRNELFTGLLKCLGFFTTLSTFQCAEQIQGDGRGYQCLVALTKDYESSAVKCIINLCYVATSRPILGAAGAVECLVDILNLQADWPESWIRALCLLCRESVNRAKIRECGGLSLLLAVAKDNTVLARHSHALHGLLLFVFDDLGFQLLMNEGLIDVIETQLMEYVETMKCEHEHSNKNKPKPKSKSSPGETKDYFKQKSSSRSPAKEKPIKTSLSLDMSNEFETENSDTKIVIERDNMIIGFNDSYESDNESIEEVCKTSSSSKKRKTSAGIPKSLNLEKMAKFDWSPSGVSYEMKSPEWPSPNSTHQHQQSPNLSPQSGYSCNNSFAMSPEYRMKTRSNKYSNLGIGAKTNNNSKPAMHVRNDWSPSSTGSMGTEGSGSSSAYWNASQWSPGSSQSYSCYSPHSTTNFDEDSSDSEKSGRYSPICSDVEESPQHQSAQSCNDMQSDFNASQMVNDLEDLIMDEEAYTVQELQPEDTTAYQTRSHRARSLLVLLSRVSHYNSRIERLTSHNLLNSLLDYVQKSKHPLNRAARILVRIISNPTHIIRLLKHRVVLHFHKMLESQHSECTQCSQLKILSTRLISQMTMIAESDYGVGEISYQLLKGDSSIRQTLAITLPYIIRSKKPLKKLLINCKALELFFTVLTTFQEPLDCCIPTLSQIAIVLKIKDPKTLNKNFKDHIFLSYDPAFEGVAPEDIVHFQLDDSSTVLANKQFLCQQSEVFNAMFTGAFKESHEKSVRLKKVTKFGLEYLLTLMHCGINNQTGTVETFPFPELVATALETLLLADRFLMDKLKDRLFCAIIQFRLESISADEIYIWSLEEGMGLLCAESVAYILAGQMSDNQRVRVISSIMDTKYKEQWLDDVNNIVTSFCPYT